MGEKPNYQKVPVADLKDGMWVCRLDSDASEGDFETCGFLYQSQRAEQLSPACRFVYVDVSRSQLSDELPSQHESLLEARKLYLNLRTQMDRVMNDIRLGNALQQKRMRRVLQDLMESVLHDSKSMVYLALLREHQDELVSKAVNVAVLSLVFAKHIGLRQDQLLPLGMGALLHPVGLLKVPVEVLNKTEPLSEDEKEMIRQYPRRGYDYLQQQGHFDEDTLDIVLHHQERTNGEGYPDRLKGKSISFLSRMVAITSVYEALTRNRSYRQALSPPKALGQLYRWRFHDFDARLVEKFIQSLGVYPPGCLVELNSGALAVVHATHPDQRLNPQVRLLTSEALVPLEVQQFVDLAEDEKLEIRKALDPHDPRLEKLLQQIMAKHPGFPV